MLRAFATIAIIIVIVIVLLLARNNYITFLYFLLVLLIKFRRNSLEFSSDAKMSRFIANFHEIILIWFCSYVLFAVSTCRSLHAACFFSLPSVCGHDEVKNPMKWFFFRKTMYWSSESNPMLPCIIYTAIPTLTIRYTYIFIVFFPITDYTNGRCGRSNELFESVFFKCVCEAIVTSHCRG